MYFQAQQHKTDLLLLEEEEMAAIKEKSIDLSGLVLQNLTKEKKKELRRIGDDTVPLAKTALANYQKNPELLGEIEGFDASSLLGQAALIEQLQPVEGWLEKHLELVRETRMLAGDQLQRGLDTLVKRARVVAETSAQVRSTYADLLDLYSDRANKAVATRQRNQQEAEEPKENKED